MTTLLLIRHAAIENAAGPSARLCGWYDAPLSQAGRWQVERLRSRLAGESSIGAIYASPLMRVRETARAAPRRLPVHYLKSLREIYCGELDGLPMDFVQLRYPDVWKRNLAQNDEDFQWPGGESYRHFRRRVLWACRALASRHGESRILIFTHAGVISELLGAIAGISAARWEMFRPANASITEVRWRGCSGELVVFDDNRHLR